MPDSGLIERFCEAGGRKSSAVYSPCGQYRYSLTREWKPELPRLLFIMLNPSKATEAQNDPTIERCERRARALGFGSFRATNLFAWRETDPAILRRVDDPVGPRNDDVIRASFFDWLTGPESVALCSWGVHGTFRNRSFEVVRILASSSRGLACLGTTKEGHPRHPLYVPYATAPVPWDPNGLTIS